MSKHKSKTGINNLHCNNATACRVDDKTDLYGYFRFTKLIPVVLAAETFDYVLVVYEKTISKYLSSVF